MDEPPYRTNAPPPTPPPEPAVFRPREPSAFWLIAIVFCGCAVVTCNTCVTDCRNVSNDRSGLRNAGCNP